MKKYFKFGDLVGWIATDDWEVEEVMSELRGIVLNATEEEALVHWTDGNRRIEKLDEIKIIAFGR